MEDNLGSISIKMTNVYIFDPAIPTFRNVFYTYMHMCKMTNIQVINL